MMASEMNLKTHSMPRTSFMFDTEAELKEYMTAMNNCIMFLYVVLGVNVPTMFENL